MGVLDVTLVAILLVGGIVCVIFGMWTLLRGEAHAAQSQPWKGFPTPP